MATKYNIFDDYVPQPGEESLQSVTIAPGVKLAKRARKDTLEEEVKTLLQKNKKQREPKGFPKKESKCTICRHPMHLEILQKRMEGMPYEELAKLYFPGRNPKTMVNIIGNHFRKHVSPSEAVNLLPVVVQNDLNSGGRIFTLNADKNSIDAQYNIEQVIINLAEKLNLLEDAFLAVHLQTRCDTCGRSENQDKYLQQMLSIIDRFLKAHDEWMKIRNPKEVMRQMFSSTFLRWTKNMMTYYVTNLQEKSFRIRQSIDEYFAGNISQQLLMRRLSEILDDLGAEQIAEKGVAELREIQKHIEKEFKKGTLGKTINQSTVPPP